MWPASYKAGIKKVRSYNKKKRSIDEVEEENDGVELPTLPPLRPSDVWDTASKVRELSSRDPMQFSDNSCSIFKETMKAVDIHLQKAHLTSLEHGHL
jgi:hypothetical protein